LSKHLRDDWFQDSRPPEESQMKTKSKPAEMSAEVRSMIDLRHQAEQRGNFSPLGRLLYLDTAHGRIEFPAERGEGTGPDLAFVLRQTAIPGVEEMQESVAENTLLVLGAWTGIPPLRRNSGKPCPKCRHACDICDGSGKKQCEGFGCGGNGWIPGQWLLCPAPGCSAQMGKPNPAGCDVCHNTGQIARQLPCPMCEGTKMMTCSRCKGTGRFSTGFINGSTDWRLPKCKACDGSSYLGTYQMQDVEKFTNAMLDHEYSSTSKYCFRVLGPIHSFCISDFESSRPRVFDVSADSAGDLLVLLVPTRHVSKVRRPGKAYLVGGVIREHGAVAVSA
jgi:hypothetical protein